MSAYPDFWLYGIPWTEWSWKAPSAGTITLELGIGTTMDGQMASIAYFDGVRLTPVPDRPWTLALTAGGLVVLLLLMRIKRRVKSS